MTRLGTRILALGALGLSPLLAVAGDRSAAEPGRLAGGAVYATADHGRIAPRAQTVQLAADENDATAAFDVGGFMLGHLFSEAAVLRSLGSANWQRSWDKAQELSGLLHVTLPKLPTPSGSEAADVAAALHFVLNDGGAPVAHRLRVDYGRRSALLFELSQKLNVALVLYTPEERGLASSICEGITKLGRDLGLEADLQPITSKIASGASRDDVLEQIVETREAIHQKLRARMDAHADARR